MITSGEVALWQYRPDSPRVNGKGKAIKYETPAGSRMDIDVPPRIRGQLADPKVPLSITEGVRKADAAVSVGLCCVALLGCGTGAAPTLSAAKLRSRRGMTWR